MLAFIGVSCSAYQTCMQPYQAAYTGRVGHGADAPGRRIDVDVAHVIGVIRGCMSVVRAIYGLGARDTTFFISTRRRAGRGRVPRIIYKWPLGVLVLTPNAF